MRSYSLDEGLLYPGAYVPAPVTERKLAILRSSRSKAKINSPVQMNEFPGSYKLEIALSGVRRDEIVLFVNGDLLTIDLLSDDQKEKKVTLPPDADMEFVCAEFRRGILTVHIPKSIVKVGAVRREIVVY